jgi:hypothetical protein
MCLKKVNYSHSLLPIFAKLLSSPHPLLHNLNLIVNLVKTRSNYRLVEICLTLELQEEITLR